MNQAASAMSTWVGTLARSGVVSGDEAAGLAVAAYVVGEHRLGELRSWFQEQRADIALREKRAAIEVCIWMANADRDLSPEEAYFLKQLVMSARMDDDTVDALVAAMHDLPSLSRVEERITHPVLRELMLALAWELAGADGKVDRAEAAFHAGLAKRLGVTASRAEELREAVTAQMSALSGP